MAALLAVIFDVDGVLVASPHERAWREALVGFADPAEFTTSFYQTHVAGRPREDGALATLQRLGVAQASLRAPEYAAKKQELIDRLIAAGSFDAFADAAHFAAALHSAGLRLALASSSKNADAMLSQLTLPNGRTLLSLFHADLCGAEVPRGKPDPAIFLSAADALGVPPAQCVVVEDAPAGIRAALAGEMRAIGIARLGDEALLRAAGANLVVTSLDQVDVAALAGGDVRSRPVVEDQRRMYDALQPTKDPGWFVRHDGYNVLTESVIESRFALSNGFLGMRAARSVSRGPTWLSWLGYLRWASWPRCYVAGLFDTPNTEPPVPALVPLPDWSRVRIILDGEVLSGRAGEVIRGVRQLDMRRGLLTSTWVHRTLAGITVTGRELRLLSQADRSAGLQLLQLSLDRDGVEVKLEANFAMAGLGMEPMRMDQDHGAWRTEGSGKCVAMAGAATLQVGDDELTAERPFSLRWVWRWRSVSGQVVEFNRHLAVARGDASDDPVATTDTTLARSRKSGWRGVLAAHEAAWEARWSAGDIVIEGDEILQRALRFAIYHLTSAANPDDDRVSIGARALTGDAYFGHVFWDTEIYLLPFYTLVWPEAARALLMYRYHTLAGARAKAAQIGCKGALYAWESADTGAETTPEHVVGADGARVHILCGRLEQHVSADIAYAVWQYWHATADDDFFLSAGAEIVLETARFWASRATLEADGNRHIRHVIGPDEYHEDIDDSAFTNVMARWNIARGIETAELISAHWPERSAELREKLQLSDEELADWRDAVDRIVTGFDPQTGLYEQFEGFHALEPFDLAAHANRTAPIDVVIGRERTQRSQVVKQADIVALIALLPEEFPGTTKELNFRHYEPRCGHGSSLSPAMHALVAARLGDTNLALRYLYAISSFDPDPNSAGGVRIAGLGGIWQAVVLGFAGLDLMGDALSIDPKLPGQWRSLTFRVCWKGRSVAVRIAGATVQTTMNEGDPLDVRIAGVTRTLIAGTPLEVAVH